MSRKSEKGSLESLKQALRDLARTRHITVGVHADESGTYPDGTSVLDVAMYAEFGTQNQRPRAWLRSEIDAKQKQLTRALASTSTRVISLALSGRTLAATEQFAAIAKQVLGGVQKSIQRKRLVKSGRLLHAVTGRIDGERV